MAGAGSTATKRVWAGSSQTTRAHRVRLMAPMPRKGVLPVAEPAGQQAADHPARDAAEGVRGDVGTDCDDQGTLAELFPM